MTTMDPQYRFDRSTDFRLSLGVGVLALLVGAIGPLRVLTSGNHGDLGSYMTWGLWVSIYVYLVWAEVGMILGYYALKHILKVKGIEKLGPVVVLTAICALLAALFIIAMDLGHPFRAFRAFTDPNFASPMTWMIWLHTIYLGLLVVEFWAYRKEREGVITALNWINVPIGVALVAVIGSLFGIVAARPFWNASMLPMTFLVSALVAGAALILLLHLLFSPLAGRMQYRETATEIGRYLMWAILIGLVAALSNIVVTIYPGVPAQREALELVLFGPYWWSIWVVHLLIGTLIPLLILARFRRNMMLLGIAATLLVVTFVMVPLNMVVPAQAYPTPELANIAQAFQHPRLSFGYFPTATEWLVVVFGIGVAVTLFAVGYKLLLDRYYTRLARGEQPSQSRSLKSEVTS